jgi:membrane fusion protein, macrolide-specific efflux system
LLGGVALGLAWLAWALLHSTDVITTVPIETGDIEDTVAALGTLQPRSYVDIGAQASGAIRRIHVRPGDVVRQGQLLLEIDPSLQQATVDTHRASLASLRAQLVETQAQTVLAQQQLRRQRQMEKDGAARTEDIETAEATLSSSEAHVQGLRAQIEGALSTLKGDEAQLGYTRIYAPMAGTVVTLDAREGQTLNATYQTPVILRIADLTTNRNIQRPTCSAESHVAASGHEVTQVVYADLETPESHYAKCGAELLK